MTTKFVRCRHCQVQYTYHPSGYTGPLNNDTYCPECWEKIKELLDDIPKKKQSIWIAAEGISEVTLAEADAAREQMSFKVNRVIFSENMRIICLPDIKGESYQISVNTDDGSRLLEIECELETNTITGTWGCGDVLCHDFERSRSISNEFWSKNRAPRFSGEVKPMSPAVDVFYQVLSFSIDEELTKAQEAELVARGFGRLEDEQ